MNVETFLRRIHCTCADTAEFKGFCASLGMVGRAAEVRRDVIQKNLHIFMRDSSLFVAFERFERPPRQQQHDVMAEDAFVFLQSVGADARAELCSNICAAANLPVNIRKEYVSRKCLDIFLLNAQIFVAFHAVF